jgi:predicted ATP-dependent serine protease
MAKEKQIFFCRECGFESAKWMSGMQILEYVL